MTTVSTFKVCLLIMLVQTLSAQNFTEIASSVGITQGFGSGYAGSGVSFVDYNQDGFDDITVGTEVGRELIVYQNDGGNSFFEVNLGIADISHQKQILWADTDNDDDLDLFITANNNFNKLYINDGNFNFSDQSISSGIDQSPDDSSAAIFGDVDNDGDLDLYICNHYLYSSKIYENTGNNIFVDRSVTAGISTMPSLNFGALFFDYDKDGDLDLYKYNDKTFANELYRNDGFFYFTDVSTVSCSALIIDAMGITAADINNNGDLDLYVTNSDRIANSPRNRLLKNLGTGKFSDISTSSGADYNHWCWGASWSDFDNDGYQDIYVSNSGTALSSNTNRVLFNNGDETFTQQPNAQMPGDYDESYACAVGDFDNDGDQDITVVNANDGAPYRLWQNNISSGNNYIQIILNGTTSNTQGIGCWVEVTAGTDTYTRFTHAGSGFMAQQSNKIHVGIGSHTAITSIQVWWPSGIIDIIPSPGINQCLQLIEGSNISTIYTPPNQSIVNSIISPSHSVARNWMDLLLESIRHDYARPTIHARNLYHSSVLMYDLWAIYQQVSTPFFLGRDLSGYNCTYDGMPPSLNINIDRKKAISYAMYRLLRHRFQNSPAAGPMYPAFDQYMAILGYNIAMSSTDYSSGDAAALGNYLAQEMINYGLNDGSNESNGYANIYYQAVNDSLVMDFAGNPNISNLNRWQPLTLDVFTDQSGNTIAINTPEFLSPEWGNVSPFSLEASDMTPQIRNGNIYKVYCNPGPPPLLDPSASSTISDWYKWGFNLVSIWSSHLDPSDGTMWDISPNTIGNIASYPTTPAAYPVFYDQINGGDASNGYTNNPVTGMPYPTQIVQRADYGRVLAEFWADGPDSETPPGHWFEILHYVSDHPSFQKKYQGTGVVLNDLEWDVKSYFSLGGTMHDAAISAWSIKGWYDYIRPVSAIRGMAELGQSSNVTLPNYHPNGMELVPGYIELVTAGDPLVGSSNEHLNKIKLKSWKGPGYITDPSTDVAGVDWILAENWWPYQRPSFVTPPFAGYVSGHSTFSRAAAEVMSMLTGSPYFPDGLGQFSALQNQFLVFEEGPSNDIVLQWTSYRDASDQCSLSRIWGGIHPPADDIPGRIIGEKIGLKGFTLAEKYINGVCSGTTVHENNIPVPAPYYHAEYITSEGHVNSPNVTFDAGQSILLEPGFQAQLGSLFLARIIACP